MEEKLGFLVVEKVPNTKYESKGSRFEDVHRTPEGVCDGETVDGSFSLLTPGDGHMPRMARAKDS